MESAFDSGVLVRVGAMNGVLAHALGVLRTEGTGFSIGRVGGTDEGTEVCHGVVFFEDGRYDGAGGHEVHQFAIEWALGVYGVEFTGLGFRQLGHFHGHDAEARSVDVVEDSTDMAVTDAIGLDHGQSSVT